MYGKSLKTTVAIAALIAIAAPAHAQLKMRVIEQAVESNTEIVSVPATLPGSLNFKPCGACGYVTLSVDSTSRFFVGKQQVTLADLHRYANRGSSRLDVFFDSDTQRVTRLILRTQIDPATAAESAPPAG